MTSLTGRQLSALKFVAESITRNSLPPTLREIGEHMGIRSTNGVNDHLRALERKGFLVRSDLKSRGIHLTDEGWARAGAESPNREPNEECYCPRCGHVFRGNKPS